jgi:phosphatidylglycerophosphatase A
MLPAWAAAHYLGPVGSTGLFVLLVLLSMLWAHRAGQVLGEADASDIVIDEVVGVWMAFVLFSSFDWLQGLVGFAAFRFFDILKPWPVGWIDRRWKNGAGVVADDLVAGVYAIPFVWAAGLV